MGAGYDAREFLLLGLMLLGVPCYEGRLVFVVGVWSKRANRGA